MSSLQLQPEGRYADTPFGALEGLARPVRDRIRQARDARKQYEGGWQMNLAYAAGKHWLVWDERARTLRSIQQADPRYRGRELYTADVVTEYRTTALGELGSDNDRPELLLQRDDQTTEEYQAQANRALGYAWDMEFDGDTQLAEVDRMIVDLGTAAIRCRFDADAGPVKAEVPHLNGKPVLDMQQAAELMQYGPNPDVEMRPIREGRLTWEPLSAFNLLVPPGATHESQFAWEVVVRPTLLATVRDRYGDPAMKLKEDGDIASGLGLMADANAPVNAALYAVSDARAGRLRDHVWLFTYYEKPTSMYPRGRTFTFAGNDYTLVDYTEQLPYQAPDGTFRSGIAYFHWWRVTGRFWSRGLMDVLKDGQRQIDKRRTQINEIIDRGLPFVMVEKDSNAKRRVGSPVELVELNPGERAPVVSNGVAPGAWMQQDVEALREDIEHATGLRAPGLGENPDNVTTYSQLALINEKDATKREPIFTERKRGIAQLVEDSVYDIRTYWGRDKHVLLAGDEDGRLEAFTFDATRIPPFFLVKIAKGSAKPRSQAAELQKITDLWNAAVTSKATELDPTGWVRWYKDSLEAGEAHDLPGGAGSVDPAAKAHLENEFLTQGVEMPIAYYDPHPIHIPIHRAQQDIALFTQDMETWQRIDRHCQMHINAAVAQAEAAQAQQAQAGAQGEQTDAEQAQRDNDLHQQSLRKASAEADLAEKKAKQSDFTPKPTTKGQ